MNESIFSNLIIEYINLVKFLVDENYIYRFDDGNIGVERSILNKLLNKHTFMDVRGKLKLWKTLNFIITEKDHYASKKWYIKNNVKVRQRIYLINLKTFHILKHTLYNIKC